MRYLLCYFSLLALPARAQLRTTPLATVPASLKHAGRVVQALRYTDRTGTYTVLTTQAGPTAAGEGQRADLYAYQYAATSTTPSWQVHDFVTDCPLDIEAQFRPKGLTVTDLDRNGVAEVWLVYRTVCRGDVSPSSQKIIMYEGTRKYAARGTTRIAVGGGQAEGGTYTLDATLQAAPAVFRQQAAQLWKQHLNETPGESSAR